MQETKTRAELLAECQAAGLRATGWKKERMAAELAALRAPAAETPGPGEDENLVEAAPPPGPGLSGWCQGAPMWSMHHPNCRAGSCSCPCHAEGWERPGYPEGARLSKFNPDRPKGEFE